MVVVRVAIELVHRDVDLVGALHQLEALDPKRDVAFAGDLSRIKLLDVGVGAVTTNAVGIEQAEAEDEILRSADARAP